MEENIFKERQEKLKLLREKGINIYPSKFQKDKTCIQIKKEFSSLEPGNRSGVEVSTAGRIMSVRKMGKANFSHLQDGTGRIQIYVRMDTVGEKGWEIFCKLDIGDIIGVKGDVFSTKTGEITIEVKSFELLSKSLRPLPEKWHGLRDIELRYRQRYLDMISNPQVIECFKKRSEIISSLRKILEENGFQEVETPILQPIPGGAIARAFSTLHQALGVKLFLRIAPELYLKRLLVGGMEKIFELSRNFRNEGISRFHNPEFTMLEVYRSYVDYQKMMELCQELICKVAERVLGKLEIPYQQSNMMLKGSWRKISLIQTLSQKTGEDFSKITDSRVREVCSRLKIECDEQVPEYKVWDRIFERIIQPDLIQPTFVLDYPVRFSPLARAKDQESGIAERFELFIAGIEVANGYSELNDPMEQRKRFERQKEDNPEAVIDEDFLSALEQGMPPAGGLGIGVDRLTMILNNQSSIRDVLLFPQLRPEIG